MHNDLNTISAFLIYEVHKPNFCLMHAMNNSAKTSLCGCKKFPTWFAGMFSENKKKPSDGIWLVRKYLFLEFLQSQEPVVCLSQGSSILSQEHLLLITYFAKPLIDQENNWNQ